MEEGTRMDGKMGWIWRKGVSVAKKVLAAVLLLISAPFVVPPLVVASTIALISSLPYCFFLASYVCTEKLMRILLPATAFGGRGDKMMLFRDKIAHGDDQRRARVALSEPILVQTEEEGTAAIAFREPLRVRNANIVVDVYHIPEDMTKESKSLLESVRGEGRTTQSLEKGFEEEDKESRAPSDAKSEKVGARVEDHLAGKKQVSGTRHEGELGSTTTEASRGKNMEKSSNEMMKVLYNEEQIWAKLEALRKIVGYSVERSTTYSEELKALYMFTGVVLPTSMLEKENQDIAQVSERLWFLMSVIGIK
ncbi:unnamed protein product [Arabis nemorensis]|uniref:Uncharacterized protein n=1 Tax=Arabis nemorensis TaxID=586526 RepID=A0A565BJL7_9BRAS|nr:unnamed protein product [Arabis nemorensis]